MHANSLVNLYLGNLVGKDQVTRALTLLTLGRGWQGGVGRRLRLLLSGNNLVSLVTCFSRHGLQILNLPVFFLDKVGFLY